MELKLTEGRYTPLPGGGLETVEGSGELVQRVLMRLTARRGSFFPDPDYGSRLHSLGRLKPSERPAAARQYVAEALADEPEVRVLGLDYLPGGDGSAAIRLRLALDGGTETELTMGV